MKKFIFFCRFLLLSAFVLQAGQLHVTAKVSSPQFSMQHSYYFSSVSVVLTSSPGTDIYYTTDCSIPSATNGIRYTTPVIISSTTVIRAVSTGAEGISNIITNSYFFPGDIIRQPALPDGYPVLWGKYTDIAGTAVADYGMDPEIVNHPDYKDLVIPALLSLPVVSVVTEKGNLFSPDNNSTTGGIYIYTGANGLTGDNWERPASVEFFEAASGNGFQVNCGLQIQGGAGRLAEKNPKHSFRLAFRDIYGPKKLKYPLFGNGNIEEFNGIILRASFGNTWRHWDANQRKRATHITDLWAKDTQLEMGHMAAHSRYVHLYLNGIYWGVYNFSERLDNDFMASYFGGTEDDYDIIKDYNELMDGNMDAWNSLLSAVNGDISGNVAYQRLIGRNPDGTLNPTFPSYVDPVNLSDYMLINFYGGNNDWDHHNWVAARNRVNPGKGFSFFCWDTEKIFENISENNVNENNASRPSGIFRKLLSNKEFKLLFADRAYLHLSNGGILTPGPVTDRWLKRAAEIDTALVAESARWGDYRRDVHSWSSGPYYLYTVNDFWLPEINRLVTSYFPSRSQVVLNQLSAAGLLPTVQPPVFSQNGGIIEAGIDLTITAGQGTIYFTLDGSDPRLTGGSPNPSASVYNKPVSITGQVVVKARVRNGDIWSALNSAVFRQESELFAGEIPDQVSGEVSIFPNPAREEVNIRFYLPENETVYLQLFSPDGQLVSFTQKGPFNHGEQAIGWPTGNLRPGIYLLRLQGTKFQACQKLFIIK